jgi:type II secretory pathway pseudopilin PulG
VHHRTVSGDPRKSDSKLASFGNPLRYNSPDCPVSHRTVSGAHRTVRCNIGATATSRSTVDCNALNARLRAQRSRARAGGTPNSLQGLSDAPPDSQAGPQVRAPTVGTQWPGDVAGAPDTVRWRTRLSGAPVDSSLHQRSSLVVGAINTPTTPTFKSSKFSTFQLLTRSIAFNTRHTKEIKSSPTPHKALVIRERDLLCSFELLHLDCFFLSHSFLISNSLVIEARDTNRVVVLAGTWCST